MSFTRATIVYELERLLKRIRKGFVNVKNPIVRFGANVIVLPSKVGQKIEDSIIYFANIIAEKVNEVQKSIEESLAMSSLYIGFLLTMAMILATVLFYVAGY
ncbi:MAG: hypothetical protein J7L82_06690 [Staphylothermus sp.]|nr:hypothetical protein [Staphylothermus sp.]